MIIIMLFCFVREYKGHLEEEIPKKNSLKFES